MNQVPAELLTLRDMVRYGASLMNKAKVYVGHGQTSVWDEAMMIALDTIHSLYQNTDLLLDCRLTQDEKKAIFALYQRRIEERIPGAYLINKSWFAGIEFYVDERVLIPRSPMAEICEAQFEPWFVEPKTILDMCTGSGCIAIAAALYCANVDVTAVDLSTEALEVAAMNVSKHHLEGAVELIQSNVFNELRGRVFDVIISNPPYVSDEEMMTLPKEFNHEPDMALRAEDAGMIVVDRLLRESAEHLSEAGVLIVEVGNTAEEVERRYPNISFTWLDFSRGGDGVFMLTRPQLLQAFG